MKWLPRDHLATKIESHLYEKLTHHEYAIRWVEPHTLVSWRRLDLGFRTLYLEFKDKCPRLAREIYYQDIKAQSLGKFVDPDNNAKAGFAHYTESFDKLYDSILHNGFNAESTLVPLSIDGVILNGGHRTACALQANKLIAVVDTELPSMDCDYSYFFRRAVPVSLIEMATVKITEFAKDIYLAFLWPSGVANFEASVSQFTGIVYKKVLDITRGGAQELVWQCYQHMDWIGNKSNNFAGLRIKTMECFPRLGKLTVIAFQSRSLDDVRKIKLAVREINGIGFSSVHITDTPEEAHRLASIVFNDEQLHFLNYRRGDNADSDGRWSRLRASAMEAGHNLSDFVIDGSSTLELYGIRRANDIDAIALDNRLFTDCHVDNHESELIYHGKEKRDLIYDPRHYFVFSGLKFISFSQSLRFKASRAEQKDLNDVGLMKSLVSGNRLIYQIIEVRQKAFYLGIRSKRGAVLALLKLLKFVGLHGSIRSIYHRLK